MTKKITLLILTIFIYSISYGQEELKLYKRIYYSADSLNKIGSIRKLDSNVFLTAKSLDKLHPSKFFESAVELLSKSKFDEAGFIFYLGSLRYRYYNSANPEYQPGNDGALLASLKSIISEPVGMYLRTNIDNFISVLKATVSYYNQNDFVFYSKNKDIEKYKDQSLGFSGFIADLEGDKEKYTIQWNLERKELENNIDALIEGIKNNSIKQHK